MSIATSPINCGACLNQDVDEKHHCVDMNCLYVLKLMVDSSNFDLGHPLFYFYHDILKARKYIQAYAKSVANEEGNAVRMAFHKDLCDTLKLDRIHFKPFECDLILDLPTFDESKVLIYRELEKLMSNPAELAKKINSFYVKASQ